MCLSVCLSARISPEPRARSLLSFVVHVAYVLGSVLVWYVDERPHSLSAGRGDRSFWLFSSSCGTGGWYKGNVIRRFNEVTLHRAWLVLGWVTIFGWANHLSISPSHGQLSLLLSVGWEMRISQSAVMLCSWGSGE